MSILLAVFSLGLLIIVHEAGHWALARLLRMRIEVFSVGFGPALVSFHARNTEFRISLIPLGGYVRIAGMNSLESEKVNKNGDLFSSRPRWQRSLVLIAGPASNWLLAFLLLLGLYFHGHRVVTGEPIIEEVYGKTAVSAGLLTGDRVLAVDQDTVSTWKDLKRALADNKNRSFNLRIIRRSTELNLAVTRSSIDDIIGITPLSRVERFSFGKSMSMAFDKTGQIMVESVKALYDLLIFKEKAQLIGPVGIIKETANATHDIFQLFFMLVQISLGLTIINLLPLPALDGGRIVFILIDLILRRPIKAGIEPLVHALGLISILGLLILLSYREIKSFKIKSVVAPVQMQSSEKNGLNKNEIHR